jgi:two-component system chemotaxis response regulator CheY
MAKFTLHPRRAISHLEGTERMPLDVLIVDDSAAIRKILHRVLVQAELPLGKVLEGLILSDINMPNMDGIEMLSKIKANEAWKNVPIIMITTEGSQEKVMQALQLGASGYVRKPFTPDQIKEKLVGLV